MTYDQWKTKHPGRTKSERRALDLIGCGEFSPPVQARVLDRMVKDGLLVELPPLKMPFIGTLSMTVRQFEMPIPVHRQWREYCAALTDEDLRDITP